MNRPTIRHRSIMRYALVSVALLVVGLAILGFVFDTALTRQAQAQQREEMTRLIAQTAAQLSEYVRLQQTALTHLASRPELLPVLQSGAAERPFRYWPLGQPPDAGPRCLAYWQRLARGEAAPGAELHPSSGEDRGHIDFGRTLSDISGRPMGVVWHREPASEIEGMLAASASNSVRWQLTQFSAAGEEPMLRVGAADVAADLVVTRSVADTPWALTLAADPVRPAFFAPPLRTPTLGAIAVVAALIATLTWVFWRIVRGTRHDIRSLARVFQDLRQGTVRVDYPMELREFRTIFLHLRRSGGELLEEQKRFKDMGLIDHLSQVHNRRAFEARLQELFHQRKVPGPSSLLMIDVDRFKAVNDNQGHDVGDLLIVRLAELLKQSVRNSDFVARLGGDEFCIVFTYTALPAASHLVLRLRKALPATLALTPSYTHALKWTGGLSAFELGDTRYDEVLWRADQALLKAKEAGRDRSFVFDTLAGGVRPL